MKQSFSFLCILLLLAGCTTISDKQAVDQAGQYLELVDGARTAEALQICSRPFLFEGEILPSQGLVEQLNNGLAGKGLSEAEFIQILPVDRETFLLFRDSWEAETWFSNYTDENTSLVFFSWRDRTLGILIDRNKDSDAPVLGLGEVEQ